MSFYLETKPDFDRCVARIEAWFNFQVTDRAPVRFHRHNAEYESAMSNSGHATLRDRWMDAEFQARSFLDSVKGQRFNAETFPVYMPNLGPNWYAAVHGAELEFGETTSWVEPVVFSEEDLVKIKFSKDNPYYRSMHELTRAALDICRDQFIVGYTDIHPAMDCAAAWRGSEQLCFDMMLDPGLAHKLADLASRHFLEVFDDFDTVLKAAGQPCATWMNIPLPGARLHIPSCDFSFMISPEQFDEYCLPALRDEMRTMTHNIYHVDGMGVANHTDSILGAGIRAIQWVQGMADLYPIMQHVPYIKKLQERGVSVIVDLDQGDLDTFMREVRPEGIFLWVGTDNDGQQHDIIKKLLKWK